MANKKTTQNPRGAGRKRLFPENYIIAVRINDDVHTRMQVLVAAENVLRAKARKKKMSLSDLVREFIDKGLAAGFASLTSEEEKWHTPKS